MLTQQVEPFQIGLVHRQAGLATGVMLHQVGYFAGPGAGLLRDTRTRAEIAPVDRRADLVEQFVALVQVLAIVELEQDHRPAGEYQGVAGEVVQGPHLHVRGVGGVADVHRVVEQDRRAVLGQQSLAHPLQAIRPRRPMGLDVDRVAQGVCCGLIGQVLILAVEHDWTSTG
ncbi:hypothetical protein D3C85_964100 [compost metagenome]